MRILGLPRYERLGSPSRLRFYQYAPWLQEAGIHVDWLPLWSDAYLHRLYGPRSTSLPMVVRRYARRLRQLRWARAPYDLIWLEAEVFPFLPAWAERYLASLGVPLVVDYDDAVFHKYDAHRRWPVRKLLSTKIDDVMGAASLVIVGNDYLRARAARSAPRVALLPTVVDLERYAPRRAIDPHGPARVGWIGSSETVRYLRLVAPALAALIAAGDIEVDLIGGGEPSLGFPYRAIRWTEATEVSALQQLDIGIMPLPDTPWERGKCGYKLIQYMACALPVVASPVGVNREIVAHGNNGMLATDTEAWKSSLKALAADRPLRERWGARGRRDVEARYALQVAAPQLVALLKRAVR